MTHACPCSNVTSDPYRTTSHFGAPSTVSGTIEISNPWPRLLQTKQYDMLQFTSSCNQAMHFALGRHTLPLMSMCNAKVGINTTAPASHFHVFGQSRMECTGSNQLTIRNPNPLCNIMQPAEVVFDRLMTRSNSAVSSLGHRTGAGCNHFFIRSGEGTPSGAVDRLVVLPDGNVGMGLDAPVANLHVNGSLRTDAGRLWMAPHAVLDSVSGSFSLRQTDPRDQNVFEDMVTYTNVPPGAGSNTPAPHTACNLWVRGTVSVNSANYAPARMTVDGPRLLVRNSNAQGGEARLWINNNASVCQWLVGQSNSNVHDLRISRLTTSNAQGGERDFVTVTPAGDVGINTLSPQGKLHVVTNGQGSMRMYDAAVGENSSNVAMPTLQITSSGGAPESALAFASPTYALYRTSNDLRLRNNDVDRLIVQHDSLARYNGPFRLFSCNIESDRGELQFGSNTHALYRTTDNSLRIRTSNTDRVTVKHDGWVGIHTTSPIERLDVRGSISFGQGMSDTASYLRINNNDDATDKILFTQDLRQGGKLAYGVASPDSLDLYAGVATQQRGSYALSTGSPTSSPSGWARRLVVANNGNATIGSNLAPPVKLLVEGEHWADRVKASNSGTPTTPSYSWVSDADTGMYLEAPNTIGFATAGQNVMNLKGGYLGIGTSAPNAQLHVTDDFQLSHSQTKTYVKTLGQAAGATQHVCTLSTFSTTSLSALIELQLTQSHGLGPSGEASTAKRYVFPLRKNGTAGEWQTVLPLSVCAPNDYAHDASLDLRISNQTATLRLRRPTLVADASQYTVMLTAYYPASHAASFSSSSAPTTEADQTAALQTYAPSVLAQKERRVGINVEHPAATLHLRSSNYPMAAADTYMNRTTNAAFESYSPMLIGEDKFLRIGKSGTALHQAALLRYVHREDGPTPLSNLVTLGLPGDFTSNVIAITSAKRMGINTIDPVTSFHLVGEATVTISNNDLFTLCNSHARMAGATGSNLDFNLTTRSPDRDSIMLLSDTSHNGAYIRLEGTTKRLLIGQQPTPGTSNNAIVLARTSHASPTAFVGINTEHPSNSLHVSGNTTLVNSNSTLRLEGSNTGYTLRLDEPAKNLRLLATSNLMFELGTIGATGALLSSSTGHFGVGTGAEQPAARLHVRTTSNIYPTNMPSMHDTYLFRVPDAPFESFAAGLATEGNLTMRMGRSLSSNDSASIRYLNKGNLAQNQLQLGFSSNATVLNLTSAGDVGIGTTSPLTKLHVAGKATASHVQAITNGSMTSASFGWYDEPATGLYRPAPERVTHTVNSAPVFTSSPSNITMQIDTTFDHQMRITLDENDSSVVSPSRVGSMLKNTSYGPKVQWAAVIKGVEPDAQAIGGIASKVAAQRMVVDTHGCVYAVGSYTAATTTTIVYDSSGMVSPTVSLPPTGTSGMGPDAAFIVKYSPGGTALWATSIDSTLGAAVRHVATDALGNVWVTGYYTGTPHIHMGVPSYTASTNLLSLPPTVGPDNAAFLLCLNAATGAPIAATVIDLPTGDDKGLGIALDRFSNVYWSGYYGQGRKSQGDVTVTSLPSGIQNATLLRPANGTSASFVIKIAAQTGQIAYAIGVDADASGFAELTTLTIANDMQIFAAGRYRGQLNVHNAQSGGLPNIAPTPSPTPTTFLLALSDEGIAQWASSIASIQASEPSAVRFDEQREMVYLSGFYVGDGTIPAHVIEPDGFPSNTVSMPPPNGYAAYLLQFARDGAVRWAVAVDGVAEDIGTHLEIDPLGYPYLCGSYTGEAHIHDAPNNAPSTATLRKTIAGSTCALIVKFSPTGRSLWAMNLDSIDADSGMGIAVDSKCNVLIASTCNKTPLLYDANNMNADNPADTIVSLPSVNRSACIIVKYAHNFYRLLADSLTDARHNGIQKLITNVDTLARPAFVTIYDKQQNERMLEVVHNGSRRLMWASGAWRDT